MDEITNLLLKRQRLQEKKELFFDMASKCHGFAVNLAFFTIGCLIAQKFYDDSCFEKFVQYGAFGSAFLLIISFIFCCIMLVFVWMEKREACKISNL